MRAVVFDAPRATPVVREVADPVCPPRGVVVSVGATGVCRSDWHAWAGHDPVALPHVPGHELAGTIVEVGPEVRRWAVGDRVTAPFVCGCGECEWCAAGEPQVCPNQTQPGFTGWGSWAERVALDVADLNLVRLPSALSFVAAAALGCRFATAYRALTAHARIEPGQWVAVHGCGGAGLSAVAIATALGARVVALDISESALAQARSLGAEVTLHSGPTAAADVVEATGGGAHASLDCIGRPAVAAASVACLRRRGRHVQVGLLLGEASTPPLPMDRVVAWELEVYGSHGMAAADYPQLLDLVGSGAVALDSLVGQVISLDDAPAAMLAMDAGDAGPGLTVIRF